MTENITTTHHNITTQSQCYYNLTYVVHVRTLNSHSLEMIACSLRVVSIYVVEHLEWQIGKVGFVRLTQSWITCRRLSAENVHEIHRLKVQSFPRYRLQLE